MVRRTGLILTIFLSVMLVAPHTANAAKHAVLVYDADTKQVLHHENGYSKRYPASLTKMMTLYMLFEQMRAGNIKPGSKMKASALAARQQQTNISMKKGNRITVDQAIRALIVRSANDVAVVVAEHIGGSEKKFAKMMTSKARMLGMRRTQFRNPHGLPNSKQTTTAYDMALLGAALRNDFPQYYHYFSTRKFSYKGKHFKSHNRVLDKLPGVDGIKTGYIRASGFNVVSSLKRGSSNIVAVVMGGSSSKNRDNRMVKLLRESHMKLASRRDNGTYELSLAPIPKAKPLPPTTLRNVALIQPMEATPLPLSKPTYTAALQQEIEKVRVPEAIAEPAALTLSDAKRAEVTPSNDAAFNLSFGASAPAKQSNGFSLSLDLGDDVVVPKAKPITVDTAALRTATTARALPKKHTLDYQLAALSKEFPVPEHIFKREHTDPGNDWAVQIGIYNTTLDARRALSDIARKIRPELKHAVADVEYANQPEQKFHRARLKNLTRRGADTVCQKLRSMQQDCFVTKLN